MTNKLKIFNWNCRHGFNSDKQEKVFSRYPKKECDFFIIQEGYKKDLDWNYYEYEKPYEYSNSNVIGIITSHDLTKLEKFSDIFNHILPYTFMCDGQECLLFAVHTKNKRGNDKPYTYEENLIAAMFYYADIIKKQPTIIVGDFNAFDNENKRSGPHLILLEKFKEFGIENCASGGKAFEPTYKHYNETKGVNDFCFSKGFVCERFEVLSDIDLSDHFPIVVELSLNK